MQNVFLAIAFFLAGVFVAVYIIAQFTIFDIDERTKHIEKMLKESEGEKG